MSNPFTLELLKEKIGAEYVEENPVTGKPRIIQGLNEVWDAIEDHGGLANVAKLFGLSELDVWNWVDNHWVPELYVPYIAGSIDWIPDVQLSSVGWEDPETGECWPSSWRLDRIDFELPRNRRYLTTVAMI
jgi:hypothetical protein